MQANIQVLAARYYPKEIAEVKSERLKLESEKTALQQKSERDAANLTKQEQRLNRISKRLLNENRRVWAIRIWAIKELSANIAFVLMTLSVGGCIGFLLGINFPAGVVCPKSSLCDHLRFQNRKLTY